jgi:hypothetical protein
VVIESKDAMEIHQSTALVDDHKMCEMSKQYLKLSQHQKLVKTFRLAMKQSQLMVLA